MAEQLSLAHLDTTTKPPVDSLSPRRRSGERVREGISKERDNSMERAPLPSPLPTRASQGEGAGDFSDGGCIKMRPKMPNYQTPACRFSGLGAFFPWLWNGTTRSAKGYWDFPVALRFFPGNLFSPLREIYNSLSSIG